MLCTQTHSKASLTFGEWKKGFSDLPGWLSISEITYALNFSYFTCKGRGLWIPLKLSTWFTSLVLVSAPLIHPHHLPRSTITYQPCATASLCIDWAEKCLLLAPKLSSRNVFLHILLGTCIWSELPVDNLPVWSIYWDTIENPYQDLSSNQDCNFWEWHKSADALVLCRGVSSKGTLFRTVTELESSYCCLVAKSCLTLVTPMDCSPARFSVHGISQARILEWLAISFSRALLH